MRKFTQLISTHFWLLLGFLFLAAMPFTTHWFIVLLTALIFFSFQSIMDVMRMLDIYRHTINVLCEQQIVMLDDINGQQDEILHQLTEVVRHLNKEINKSAYETPTSSQSDPLP